VLAYNLKQMVRWRRSRLPLLSRAGRAQPPFAIAGRPGLLARWAVR
jgi:hypothetical protein